MLGFSGQSECSGPAGTHGECTKTALICIPNHIGPSFAPGGWESPAHLKLERGGKINSQPGLFWGLSTRKSMAIPLLRGVGEPQIKNAKMRHGSRESQTRKLTLF